MFSHGQSNARGVAILFSRDIDLKINNFCKDESGRFLLLDCLIREIHYIIVNVYAPTIDKVTEQKRFGQYLLNELEQYNSKNIIIGGDFNIELDRASSEPNSLKNPMYAKQITTLMEMLSLVDIWRLRNPTRKRYTRRERTKYGFSQSRLDYFIISCHLEYFLKNTDILPSIKSDHSLLCMNLSLVNEPKRGKGTWKLNVSLLEDED